MHKNGDPTKVSGGTIWIDVTPGMARRWLTQNTHNRKLSRSTVLRYAADMSAGRWRKTHQGIAFNCEEILVDGQHRLEAIVESGTVVPMLVTWGIDMESQLVVDDHKKRNPYDSLSLLDDFDERLKPEHVQCAGCMMRHGVDVSRGKLAANKLLLKEFLAKHFDAIDFAIASLHAHGKRRGLTNAAITSCVARAWYTRDHQRLQEWCEVLLSGEMKTEIDVAAIAFRNWALETFARQGSGSQAAVYSRCQRMMKAFLDRQPLRKCLTANEECFQIPGDERTP